ncbi:hypothetical protein I8751_12490 [Nostocaceae cyanobacterium CENA357]|uniref:Uncharacterized protein n=1 Tax=Atlanticothrix silvestris CENA357 TaxID=1725252 RepID=A0A8J7HHS3_9CYAN|nr:hypothetical protein [Atlanticothrix silvestris CENA357]
MTNAVAGSTKNQGRPNWSTYILHQATESHGYTGRTRSGFPEERPPTRVKNLNFPLVRAGG